MYCLPFLALLEGGGGPTSHLSEGANDSFQISPYSIIHGKMSQYTMIPGNVSPYTTIHWNILRYTTIYRDISQYSLESVL